MKAIKAIHLLMGVFLISAGASKTYAAEGWYQDYVRSVYPLATGDFVVTFVNSPATCLGSSNPKYFHVEVGKFGVTADGVKAMLATALTAYAAGKRLTVVFDDTSVDCSVNRMSVSD